MQRVEPAGVLAALDPSTLPRTDLSSRYTDQQLHPTIAYFCLFSCSGTIYPKDYEDKHTHPPTYSPPYSITHALTLTPAH